MCTAEDLQKQTIQANWNKSASACNRLEQCKCVCNSYVIPRGNGSGDVTWTTPKNRGQTGGGKSDSFVFGECLTSNQAEALPCKLTGSFRLDRSLLS